MVQSYTSIPPGAKAKAKKRQERKRKETVKRKRERRSPKARLATPRKKKKNVARQAKPHLASINPSEPPAGSPLLVGPCCPEGCPGTFLQGGGLFHQDRPDGGPHHQRGEFATHAAVLALIIKTSGQRNNNITPVRPSVRPSPTSTEAVRRNQLE